jgi:DNA-directed RNA polymerase subunit RPC12/RpoP
VILLGRKDKEERKYKCGWCRKEFKQNVGNSGGGKHSNVSSQVKCPNCGNFIKTYPD